VGGSPCSVAADPHVPQRFYMGVEGRGVLRSDDGGRTWRSVLEKRVRHVAVDAAVPDRIAAGAADGIMISRDGGQTWEMLDQRLPHRYYNLVSFAGDRVIAGSHGSGAFWMPLTEAAARSVKATPAKAEPPPTQDGGDARAAPRFSEDPRDWHLWTASGNLAASRDDVTVRSKPFALRLASVDGRAGGSIAHVIPPNSAPFKLSGVVRSAGEVEECLLAVQVFDSADKQIEWNHVADGKAAADWTAFEKRIELPAAAARCNLVLTLKGDGEAWLDDLKAEPIIDVFLATPRELEVNR
jgi:hypothetical protein